MRKADIAGEQGVGAGPTLVAAIAKPVEKAENVRAFKHTNINIQGFHIALV